jgi:hypothetical protein
MTFARQAVTARSAQIGIRFRAAAQRSGRRRSSAKVLNPPLTKIGDLPDHR